MKWVCFLYKMDLKRNTKRTIILVAFLFCLNNVYHRASPSKSRPCPSNNEFNNSKNDTSLFKSQNETKGRTISSRSFVDKNLNSDEGLLLDDLNETGSSYVSQNQTHSLTQLDSKYEQVRVHLENISDQFIFPDYCLEYYAETQRKFTIYENVNTISISNTENPYDITLVTHTSMDRINSLQKLIKSWKGPISVALYIEEKHAKNATNSLTNWLCTKRRSNVQIHIVEQYGRWYPKNHLRNIAMVNVITDYVLAVDVEIVPMPVLYEQLVAYLPKFFENRTSHHNVLVIPTFTVYNNISFPLFKEDVVGQWNKTVRAFSNARLNCSGDPTNYDHWIEAKNVYEVGYVFNYDPFIVIKRNASPRYDELFLRTPYDHVSYVYELYSRGFHFWIHPYGFMTHVANNAKQDVSLHGIYDEKSERCSTSYMYDHFRYRMIGAQKILGQRLRGI